MVCRIEQRVRADHVGSQLCEVGVAGDDETGAHRDVSVRLGVFDIVVNRTPEASNEVASAPVWKSPTFEPAFGTGRVFAKSCYRRDDLERRAGRIQSVARAIEQGII